MESACMTKAMSSVDIVDISHFVRVVLQHEHINVENVVSSVIDDMVHMGDEQRRDRLYYWWRSWTRGRHQ